MVFILVYVADVKDLCLSSLLYVYNERPVLFKNWTVIP